MAEGRRSLFTTLLLVMSCLLKLKTRCTVILPFTSYFQIPEWTGDNNFYLSCKPRSLLMEFSHLVTPWQLMNPAWLEKARLYAVQTTSINQACQNSFFSSMFCFLQVHKDKKSPFLLAGCKVADGFGNMVVRKCSYCLIGSTGSCNIISQLIFFWICNSF